MAEPELTEYEGDITHFRTEQIQIEFVMDKLEMTIHTIGDYHVDTVWNVVEKSEKDGLLDLVLSPDGIEDPEADTLVEMVSDGIYHIRYLYAGREWLQCYRMLTLKNDEEPEEQVALPSGYKRMTLRPCADETVSTSE